MGTASALVLVGAGLWAGAQNAVAGGGSFVTLMALISVGLDPLTSNVTSTVALFPGQVVTGWAGRTMTGDTASLSFRSLLLISLVGGMLGAALLLLTPVLVFSRILPFLLLFAIAVFAWGNFGRRPGGPHRPVKPVLAAGAQLVTAIYGGYFGGGIGFLMLAVFAVMRMPTRHAIATKNVLAAAMNASAFLLLIASPFVEVGAAVQLGAGAVSGGYLGAKSLRFVDERVLKVFIVLLGLTLAAILFARAA